MPGLVKSKKLLECRIFTVERLDYETKTGSKVTRDVVRHPGSVAIVPLLDNGQVCLITNRRVSIDKTLIEIPAGTLEVGEEPLACADRELMEETGYRAGSMRLIKTFFPAPGILDEQMFLFVASELTGGDPKREVDEQIDNYVVSLDDALSYIADGRIEDAKTIIGLLLVEKELKEAVTLGTSKSPTS